MELYRLVAEVTVSTYTQVEASSLEEAVCIAKKRAVGLLNSGYFPDTDWVVEEADGDPQNIRIGD